jgi:hypothetical protein
MEMYEENNRVIKVFRLKKKTYKVHRVRNI